MYPEVINKEVINNLEVINKDCANAPLAEPFTKVDEIELPENPIPLEAEKKKKTPPRSAKPPLKKEKGESAEAWTKTIAALFDKIGEENGAQPFNWKVNEGRDFKALKEIRVAMAGDIQKKQSREPSPQEIEAGFEYLFRYGFKYLEKIAREKGGAIQYSPQTIKNCYNQIVSYAKGNHSGQGRQINAATKQHFDLAVYVANERRKLFEGANGGAVEYAESVGAV